MSELALFFALSPEGWTVLALLVGGLLFLGLTYLVPRRFWGWLLLIGCPLLAFGPVAAALLLDRM